MLMVFFSVSCDFSSLSEPVRTNEDDAYGPNADPRIIDVKFLKKLSSSSPALFEISAIAASQVRIEAVADTNSPLTSSYIPTATRYPVELPIGKHLIAAQTRAANGHTSAPFYGSFSIKIGGLHVTEEFDLGQSGEKILMTWIPADTFLMGTTTQHPDARSDAMPKRRVIISKPFWMGVFEVTQTQWTAVTGTEPFKYPGTTSRPAENISWKQIQDDFLSVINNEYDTPVWRLPTEAEWEFACRSGEDENQFWWGDGLETLFLFACHSGDYTGFIQPVGSFNVSPWGLYDIYGNISEFCSDWYDSTYYADRPDPDIDPQGPATGEFKVHRGGNFVSDETEISASMREFYYWKYADRTIGFRLVRTVDE